jgi:hypothetical protein
MFFKRAVMMLFVVILSSPMHACSGTDNKEEDAVFKKVPELQEIKPRMPVKIKLKRSKKGEYSWDLSGSNADEVLKVDKKLKESLKEGLK